MTTVTAAARWRRRARSPWALVVVVAALMLGGVWGIRVTLRLRQAAHLARETRYDAYIWDASRRHGVSPFLVKAVIWRESRFRPLSFGGKGEVGLMQITEGAVLDWHRGTGQRLPCQGQLLDPRLNIEIGTWYLGRAVRRWGGYRGGEILALAQYNAGPRHAARWAPEDPGEKVPLERIGFPGTQAYIRSIRERRLHFEKEHRAREQG